MTLTVYVIVAVHIQFRHFIFSSNLQYNIAKCSSDDIIHACMLIHKFQISCTCFPTITTMKQADFNVLLQIIDATYSGEDTKTDL